MAYLLIVTELQPSLHNWKNHQPVRKEYLEKLQEKKAAEKKEAKKKEQSKQTEVRKTTVQANSKEELLDKIKNIDWDSIKPEENKIGGRFDFLI